MASEQNQKESKIELAIPIAPQIAEVAASVPAVVKPKAIWSNSMYTSDVNGSKMFEVEGVTCLMVDKQCMTDEEGMRDLISLLQKNKSKIEGIVITDFEGSFKIDYFKRIELSLREIDKLRTIIINNSNLTREHIQILRNIIWWRREQIQKILLSKNSMDSLDFNDLFVQDDFNVTDIKNLRTLEIRVQPGINKLTKTQFAEFTSLLVKQNAILQRRQSESEKKGAKKLAFNNSSTLSEKQLKIMLDETSLNHQNKKIIRMHSDTLSSLHLDESSTNQKLFYSLNLGGCFQDRNESALRYFGEYLLAENFDDIVSLSFAKTQLKNIDNWIPVFTFLKKTKSILDLDLSDCSLQDRVLDQLFSSDLAIKSLNLSNNNSISMNGWKKMVESVICNPKSVTVSLKLDNCYFEEAEIIELSGMISRFANKMKKNTNYLCALQKLYLNNNHQLSAKSLGFLMSSIFNLTKRSLETIELRECAFNGEKLTEILNAMKASFAQTGNCLDEVVLRNNPGLAKAQVELQNTLSFLMSDKIIIKKIDISNCGVTSQTIERLSEEYLRSHKKLQQLVLKNNPDIQTAGYTEIAKHFLFTDNCSLDKLDISNNCLTAAKLSGFLEIAEQFKATKKVNKVFEKLFFKQNKILEADCFDRMCKSVFFSPSMRIKKLSLKNSLNDDKVNYLVAFVKQILQDSRANENYVFPCLEEIGLDKNNHLRLNSMVELLEIFLIQNNDTFAFPAITRVTLAYCNICDPHMKELLQRTRKNRASQMSSSQTKLRALQALSLKGNTCFTSNGWMMIAYLVFRSGYFENLEKLDFTYCKLEETGVSQICTQFLLSVKDKSTSFKHPLKEFILDKNSMLESSDLITIFNTFIFKPFSQIKHLSLANSGVDSTAIQWLVRGVSEHIRKEIELGFIENNRLPLINLNLSGNDAIDDVTWKQFMKVFILNKPESVELQSEIEAQLKQEKADRQFVGDQFNTLVGMYKEKITRLSIPNKIPVFTIQELNLRGTTGLESQRWVELFSKLVVTKQSQIKKLNMSSTYIEKKGWVKIFEVFKNFESSENNQAKMLQLKHIDFSENDYLEQSQWQLVSQNLFFNTTLIQLESLSLSACRISQTIMESIVNLGENKNKPLPDLVELNLNRNYLNTLIMLKLEAFPKLKTIQFASNQIPVSMIKNAPLLQGLEKIVVTIDSNETENHLSSVFVELLDGSQKLKFLTVRGFQPLFAIEFPHIFQKLKSRQLSLVDFNSQQIKQVDLFNAICEANSFLNTFNFTSGSIIQSTNADSNQSQQQSNFAQQVSMSKNNPTLQSLDLSSLYTDQPDKTENVVMNWVMKYIGKCCSALVKLHLKKCMIYDESLVNFCKEYTVNKAFKLQEISLANNTQYTNAAWSSFFEHVLLNSEKNSLRSVEISGNSFNAETFSILAEKAKRMTGKIEIEHLYLENIYNIPAQAWTQHFFQDFIMLDSIKVKYLYIDRSLTIDSMNAVFAIIKAHTQNPSCSLRNVFGYYDIEQHFYALYETQERTINLKTNLEQASQLTVRDLWKKGLVTPSVKSINCDSSLSEEFVNAIPEMTLDFIQDLLSPLNDSLSLAIHGTNNKSPSSAYKEQKTPEILCFDYDTIVCLQRYFNLDVEEQSQDNSSDKLKNGGQELSLAYPYNIILQPRFSNFLMNTKVFTRIYFMQHRLFDVIDSRQIYMLYLQLKDTRIDSIIIDYDLRQVDLPANLSERELINLIRLFPPKSLVLDNVSINALKAIYSILASNINFRYANVNFSSKSFINNGIAFSLREQLFTGKKRRNFFLRAFEGLAYYFFDLFCVEAQVYKFDNHIPILNEQLKQKRFYFNLMIILTFVYYLICIFAPYLLTRYYDGNYFDKSTAIATLAYIIYGAFAVVSLIAEVLIYHFAFQQVKHLMPKLVDVENIDKQDKSIVGRINIFLNSKMGILEWISFFLSLIFSQIDRFDLFSDVCFIVICFKQEYFKIGLVSLAVIVSQLSSNLGKLCHLGVRVYKRGSKRVLNTHEINQFCEISNLIEFEALNNVLDTVAPYNISFIPNNFFFRFFFPSAAGQSISNRLFVSMQKFLLEDALQIIIQVAFVIQQDQGDSTVIISIATSILSILKAFYKFMSIRPSTTSQLDFDFLSKQKRAEAEQHRATITEYRNNMLNSIKIAVDSYLPTTNITVLDTVQNQPDEDAPLKVTTEAAMLTASNKKV